MITEFIASRVFSDLSFNINFRPETTFIVGLNGSGKTTALRLLMGLITPSLADLARLSFASLSLSIRDPALGITRTIQARKDRANLKITITGVEEVLVLPTYSRLRRLADYADDEEFAFVVQDMAGEHRVLSTIANMVTPMFLGVDRRSRIINAPTRTSASQRRAPETSGAARESMRASLLEVQDLVRKEKSRAGAEQANLIKRAQNEFLLEALTFYKQGNVFQFHNRNFAELREKKNRILSAYERFGIEGEVFEKRFTSFLNQLENAISLAAPAGRPQQKRRREDAAKVTDALNTWLINAPQLDRLARQVELAEVFSKSIEETQSKLRAFLNLTNEFFAQTKKQVSIADDGQLEVARGGRKLGVSELSSGEQQVIIILGHLILNPMLADGGVFIVDEPELSLHISWQEMFVDALRKANPNVQLILATHSPAIILDRDEFCEPISGGPR